MAEMTYNMFSYFALHMIYYFPFFDRKKQRNREIQSW